MGQTYVKTSSASKIGDMSFHFDQKRPFIDFTNTRKGDSFAKGAAPGKVYFLPGWKYTQEQRMFEGKISSGKGLHSYEIKFDEDFVKIEKSELKTKDGSTAFGSGVSQLEYSVVHDKRPVEFKYKCQALKHTVLD